MEVTEAEAGILGSRVRNRRLELGMCQDELAEKAGIHHSYLNRLEAGELRDVFNEILERIALHLRLFPGRKTSTILLSKAGGPSNDTLYLTEEQLRDLFGIPKQPPEQLLVVGDKVDTPEGKGAKEYRGWLCLKTRSVLEKRNEDECLPCRIRAQCWAAN